MESIKLISSFMLRFMAFLVAVGLTAAAILKGYVVLQAHFFRAPDTLLFVQGKYYSYIVIFGIAGAGYYSLGCWRQDAPRLAFGSYRPPCAVLAAAFLITCFAAAGDEFFRYSRITADSIYVRNGFWRDEQRFALAEVRRVEVAFVYGKKGRRSIDYLVSLPDGRQLNLYYAKDFKPGIVAVEAAFARHSVAIAGTPLSAFPEYRPPAGK